MSANLDSLFDTPFDDGTRVINIRSGEHYDVRIDRQSIWGNPFSHLNHSLAKYRVSSRDEAVDLHKPYLVSNAYLVSRLGELEGLVLGCWCYPKRCHGNNLIWAMRELKMLNYESLADCHPKLSRGIVWCTVCGREQRVDPVECVAHGWPKCHGYTMTIDSPEERKKIEGNS